MWSLRTGNLNLPAWLRENKNIRKSAVICAALLCLDLLLYAFLVLPPAAALREQESRYAELRKQRTEAVLFQKQKQALAGLMAGIPTQKDMPLLVKDLFQTAKRLNLSVSSIQYDMPKRSGEALSLLSFSFPAEGRYGDIKRFIHEVETSDRLVGIEDVSFDGGQGRVKIQMKLVTYIKGQ